MKAEENLILYQNLKNELQELKNTLETIKQNTNIDYNEPVLNICFTGKIKYIFRKILQRCILNIARPYIEQQNYLNKQMVEILDRALENLNEFQFLFSSNGNLEKESDAVENKNPNIYQIVSSLNYGDAVGNDVMAIQKALKESGYTTAVYALYIHPKVPFGVAYPYRFLPKLKQDDIVIYHFASGDPLAEYVKTLNCKKILRYHNVTPPHFFKKYDRIAARITKYGLIQVKSLCNDIDYVMADSEFNKTELKHMGYQCEMSVVPVLIPFEDYAQQRDERIVQKYSDDLHNIIFVGRIAPNKRIEDIILSFAIYKRKYDPGARLILVGSYGQNDRYYNKLQQLINKEQLQDVVFTGHISFSEILAYYSVANIFLCLSEHEGFCVPLLEAMYFNVPIIAYNSTAVSETLGDAGVLLSDKSPSHVADEMNQLINSVDKKKYYITLGQERLMDFQYDVVKKQIISCLKNIAF